MHGMDPHDEIAYWRERAKRAEQENERLKREKPSPPDEIFEHGFWRSCSGCHSSDEGHPTGPYSDAFRCNLGVGCFECGGIGATWEQFEETAPCPCRDGDGEGCPVHGFGAP